MIAWGLLLGLLNAQRGIFQLVRVNPRDVGGPGVFLDQDRFESRLGLHLIKALAQNFRVEVQAFRERLDQRSSIDALGVFARKDDRVDRLRVNQHVPVAIENHAARRGDRQLSQALVLGNLGITRPVDNLNQIEPDAEHGEHHQHQHLDDAQPHAQVL